MFYLELLSTSQTCMEGSENCFLLQVFQVPFLDTNNLNSSSQQRLASLQPVLLTPAIQIQRSHKALRFNLLGIKAYHLILKPDVFDVHENTSSNSLRKGIQ